MMPKDRFSFRLDGTTGKGVLLIHGLTGVPAEMKLVARHLHRNGYSIYAPLLAGHGVDKEALVRSRWQDWLDGVVADAEIFGKEVDALYVAGICVGGKLGMMAARQLPDLIKATAIYSPCFRYDGWNAPWYWRLVSVALPIVSRLPWLKDSSSSETESLGVKDERLRNFMKGAETEGVIDQFPVRSLLEMRRLGEAMKRDLRRMTTPVLILHATEDDLSGPNNARLIASRIGAPHELRWIEDSYHMIHVDRQNRKVADLTAAFFEKNDVRAAA
jgi:carboxylesterase